MNNKFLFVEKKKLIIVSAIIALIIATLFILLKIDVTDTQTIEKIASTEQTEAMKNVDVENVVLYHNNGILYGDIDGDTQITTEDAKLVEQALSGLVELSDDQKIKSDVNQDGKITIEDVEIINEYGQGVITIFPIQQKEENKLDGKMIVLPKQVQYKLLYGIEPENATNKSVYWESSNPSVAEVNEQGIVTAIGTGEATITVITKEGEFRAQVEIMVPGIEIYIKDENSYEDLDGNGIITKEENRVTGKTLGIENGLTYKLYEEVVLYEGENRNIIWESSNPNVVTVNNGEIKGVGAGEATITVKTEDEKYIASVQVLIQDTTKPTITFGIEDNTSWLKNQSINIAVEDQESGIDDNSLKYKWTLAKDGMPAEGEFIEYFKNTSNIALPQNVEGEYKLWILAKDKAGNTVCEASPIIKIDTKAPQAEFSKLAGNIKNKDIITVSITDFGSGIYNIENKIQEQYSWHKVNSTYSEEIWEKADITKINNGYQFDVIVPEDLDVNEKYILVLSTAGDILDNVGQELNPRVSPQYIYIDNEAPTKPIIDIIKGEKNQNLEYANEAVVRITQGIDRQIGTNYTDLIIEYSDGINTKQINERITERKQDFTLNQIGTYNLTAITYDKAGNKAQTGPYQIIIIKSGI